MQSKAGITLYKDSKGTAHKSIFNIKRLKEDQNLNWTKKIIDRDKVKNLARQLKAKNEVVVFTPGAFDMIHVGQARYLALGKSLGTVLVVGMNSDDSIRSYKGDDRPILNQDRRAEMLAHLAVVDYVVIFDDTMAGVDTKGVKAGNRAKKLADLATKDNFKGEFFSVGVIRDLKPDRLLCIEEHWEGRLHERPEVKTVLEYGGEVFCSPRQDQGLSTSKIITKLMEDGKRNLVKEIGNMLNQGDSFKGSL